MKKILYMFGVILLYSCSPNADENIDKDSIIQKENAKIQELANKYGVTLSSDFTIDAKTVKRNSEGIYDFKELESFLENNFRMLADAKKLEKENNLQVAQMAEEVKNRKELLPSDYLKLLDKYPLVKQSCIQQQGGEAGFQLYKSRLFSKQDSVLKSQHLKLKN